MAICVFRLTRNRRFHLALAFTILDVIQVLLGLFLTCHAIYVYATVTPGMSTERAEVTFVFAVTAMYGTHVIFHYLAGIRICEKCFKQSHKKSTRKLLLLWSVAGFNTMINLLILSAMYPPVSRHIIKSMKNSLEKGIRTYFKDISLKETIDSIQYKMECCGIDSYDDWYKRSWLTPKQINFHTDLVRTLRSSKNYLHLPVVPWSCCRLDYPMQCLHDPLQQTLSTHIWMEQPDVVLESIHTSGCLEKLRSPIQSSLKAYTIVIVVILILQVIIVFMSRILYTACRNSILLGNPYGTAPGWFFGRGDCGYARGKTLSQMMVPEKTESSPTSYDSPKYSTEPTDKDVSFVKAATTTSPNTRSDEDPISSAEERDLLLK